MRFLPLVPALLISLAVNLPAQMGHAVDPEPVAAGAEGSEYVPAVPSDLKMKYDRLSDVTTVSTKYYVTGGGSFLSTTTRFLKIVVEAQYPGKVAVAPIDSIKIVFSVVTRSMDLYNRQTANQAAARSDALASETADVRLLVDDSTRLTLTAHLDRRELSTNTLSQVLAGDNGLSAQQVYSVTVPSSLIVGWETAKTIEGSIAGRGFKMDGGDIHKLTSISQLFAAAQ
jgi:hypothetical protein